MSLENIQYDEIMREYHKRQLDSRHLLDERRERAYRLSPRLKEIQDDIASLSAQRIHNLLGEGQASGKFQESSLKPSKSQIKESSLEPGRDTYQEELGRLSRERASLLDEYGFPPDYLDMPYHCPDCRDTGYTSQGKCHCFHKLASDLLCRQYGLEDVLEKENFQLFSFSFYSDTITDKSTGKTPREHARYAVERAWDFIGQFGQTSQNLFIYGDTGVGKTFLSHCIAHEILKKACSVLYFPSYDLFRLLAKETFGQEAGGGDLTEYVLNCDLLILDDLGTELTNTFVSSQLFQIVNERQRKEKPVVISTNLALEAFPGRYSTRTFSRILQGYKIINLIGKDIRNREMIQED